MKIFYSDNNCENPNSHALPPGLKLGRINFENEEKNNSLAAILARLHLVLKNAFSVFVPGQNVHFLFESLVVMSLVRAL